MLVCKSLNFNRFQDIGRYQVHAGWGRNIPYIYRDNSSGELSGVDAKVHHLTFEKINGSIIDYQYNSSGKSLLI